MRGRTCEHVGGGRKCEDGEQTQDRHDGFRDVILLEILRAALLATAALLSIPGLPQCGTKSEKSDASDASAATATVASATAPMTTASAKSSAAPVNDRADVEKATALFEEIEDLANKGTLKDAAKPNDPDAQARCATFDTMRAKLEKRPEPEVKTMLDSEKKVCGFDVPLLVAEDGIKQLGFSGSQASKQLSCNVIQRELEKARAVKADDPKVRSLDGRYHSICGR